LIIVLELVGLFGWMIFFSHFRLYLIVCSNVFIQNFHMIHKFKQSRQFVTLPSFTIIVYMLFTQQLIISYHLLTTFIADEHFISHLRYPFLCFQALSLSSTVLPPNHSPRCFNNKNGFDVLMYLYWFSNENANIELNFCAKMKVKSLSIYKTVHRPTSTVEAAVCKKSPSYQLYACLDTSVACSTNRSREWPKLTNPVCLTDFTCAS